MGGSFSGSTHSSTARKPTSYPAFSSQTCSKCGHQSSTNRNSDGWFECNECGYEVDGDYNASKNIGKRLLSLPEGKRPLGVG
ncbi:transposase [Haloterrigena salifodinae]|uniref:Transposase n=1 Tax=Haloterrigena salifodinae TaxID=2675099 RepID=A0A8T8E631_9EURY|nr:transposase [Haloterrigena salifodinae]